MLSEVPSTGFTESRPVLFTAAQLRQVLSAYAEGVLIKNWRDYAIDSGAGQTSFCVVERGQGQPAAVLYSISRTKAQKSGNRDYYRVFDGEKQVCRSESFLEALGVFRELGKPGPPKKKLKLIR